MTKKYKMVKVLVNLCVTEEENVDALLEQLDDKLQSDKRVIDVVRIHTEDYPVSHGLSLVPCSNRIMY